ncbi:MAG: D-alanine--D-alanine ligase [Synechococcales cyanobacterium M58_A2018_015]|nr:D-alanine--D-alanine ligase [Synechococcales cyanobacterium M58_A2018_015]
MATPRILHLVGSAYDDFYGDLSRLYAQDCLAATADLPYEVQIAYITPDQQWRFPRSLSPADLAAAQPMPMVAALSLLMTQPLAVMLPQMFCLPGMTHYRALFDLLKVPYVGNPPEVMALAAHKARTKAVVAAAGVPVPRGEVLRSGELPTIPPPAIVKPVSSDNSLGVTLVEEAADYPSALSTAFTYAQEVLVEEFVPLGREVRCGVISSGDGLIGLPLEEYWMDCDQQPIRSHADKLKRLDSGELGFAAKDKTKSWIVDSSDSITERVQALAQRCHQALGCRHYSLFDFRIDPQGQPWFLEAGLYCSFSPKSVLVAMAEASGIPLQNLLMRLINQAIPPKQLLPLSAASC